MGVMEGLVEAGPAPRGGSRRAGLYCVLMFVARGLSVGVGGVAVQFLYKERFHLTASQTALYGVIPSAPLFVGFLFGFLRDRVRPRGWGDRAYFLAGAAAIAALDLALATGEMSLPKLIVLLVGLACVGAFVGAASNGLLAAVSKEHGMTGRLSGIGLVAAQAVGIFATAAGGWLDGRFGTRVAFLASAALALPMLGLAFWRPRAVFPGGGEAFETVVPEGAGAALRRLLRHRAVFAPAAILFLWNFAPGWGTPLFYFLTNSVKLSEGQYGTSQSILALGALLASLSYAGLCQRFPLRSLLVVGTVLGILGCPIFLLIHGAALAYGISFLAGVSCGFAVASYYDLLSRACPKDLEGVAYMLTVSAYTIAGSASDVFGSWLYDRGGFGLALAATTLSCVLILPVLALVPRSITAPPEGERLVDADPPRGEATAVVA